MDTIQKLQILSEDSQYDLACACGSTKDSHRKRTADGKWLYPVPLVRGGSSVLLKTLISNACVNDCKYCPLRANGNVRRCTLRPEETASIFMDYLRRREVFGLFLSSGVPATPDGGMEKLIDTAGILRRHHNFKGYIHLKILPGASDAAVEEAMKISSAVSLNIEVPGRKHFEKLSSSKDYDRDIIRPLKLMSKLSEKGSPLHRVKCTTQFIVGASDENDSEIIKYMGALYSRLKFDRVYFSAYQAGLGDSTLPAESRDEFTLGAKHQSLTREHRLYQVDFLLRRYGFSESEINLSENGFLSLDKDPKQIWAESHPDFFPVNINSASKEELLRVPGLGPETVNRIFKLRKIHSLGSLAEVGVKGKRLEEASRYSIMASF